MPEKSFGDVLSEVLSSWRIFQKFLLLLVCMAAVLAGVIWLVFNFASKKADELQLEEGDIKASVLFRKPVRDGQEYTVMISPQGWQRTGVQVQAGDTLIFEAGGKVYVDLKGLNASLDARDAAERRIENERKKGQWKTTNDSDFLPEHYFTADEVKNMKPKWGWTGPDGIPLDAIKRYARPARQRKSICPSEGYGALLAAIGEQEQNLPGILFVGSSQSFVADRDGWLFLAVNDVTNDEDPSFPDMFFVDNIGVFYARVRVFSSGKKPPGVVGEARPCTSIPK